MLELNSSFIWIFFLVWLLYLLLNRIFFRPISRVIGEREAKVAADSARLAELVAGIEDQTRVVEARLSEARQEARMIREEWLKNGEEIRSRTVAEARERTARVLGEKITQLEGEIAAAERSLQAQLSVFSDKIRQAYS